MYYLNSTIEKDTMSISRKSLVNREGTESIFKPTGYNKFLVKESGTGIRTLSYC